jgi:hypothetical protein
MKVFDHAKRMNIRLQYIRRSSASRDPQAQGRGRHGIKSDWGRAAWVQVWTIDEQPGGLPVGAEFKHRSYF